MGRRLPVILLLLGILGATAWTLLRWNVREDRHADPWEALPAQAAVILEVPAPLTTWDRWTHTTQLWDAIGVSQSAKAMDALLRKVSALSETQPALLKELNASSALVAVVGTGGGPGTLVIWPMQRNAPGLEALGTALGIDLSKNATSWSGTAVGMSTDTALAGLRFAWKDGLALIGSSGPVLDEALIALDKHGQLQDSTFLRAKHTLGAGTDGHLLVHLDRAERLLGRWLTNAAVEGLRWPNGWVALDLRVRPEAVLLSGLVFPEGTDSTFALLSAQGIGRSSALRVLPTSVTTLVTQQVSDPQRFLEQRGAANDSLAAAAFRWCRGMVAVATSPDTATGGMRSIAVFRTDEPEAPLLALAALCPPGGCDTANHRGVRMVRSPVPGALGTLLGPAFERFEQPWYAMLGDKAVCSDSPDLLKESIDAFTDGRSLATDEGNADFMQRYATDAAFTVWADAGRSSAWLGPHIRSEAKAELNESLLAGLGRFLVQLGPAQNGAYPITLCLQQGAPVKQEVGVLWSSAIGRPLIRGPFIVRNHVNRTQEVLVQDNANVIHLLSSTGNVLWKRELEGPIMGEVQQVDEFRNGKLQLLFNTEGRIHLIDRNGKDVGGFPVILPGKASAPISVFDYDGSREYRVLVPTVNATLLNYDLNGKPVQGWVPPRTTSTCHVPVQHLRLRAKDHLVLVDHGGDVTVLDRKGAPRYSPKLKVSGAARIIGLRTALEIGACRVLWVDSAGTAFSGTFDGVIEKLGTGATAKADDKGLLLYPIIDTIRPDAPVKRERDINLDGTPESIIAYGDGRVVVQRAQP